MFRTFLAMKSFKLDANETSPSSLVSDVIRKLDLEAARYQTLLLTLPSGIDTVGLQLTDADLLTVLIRSLPEQVKAFALHHSTGDSYLAYREAARRWEHNQRLFQDLSPKAGKGVSQLGSNTEWFWFDDGEEAGLIDAVGSQVKCTKCGSKKHETASCTVDLTKIKCFRCGQFGHVGLNCSQTATNGGKSKRSSTDGKGYGGNGNGNQKGHQKAKGKWKREIWQERKNE